jgi:hypothetical protein
MSDEGPRRPDEHGWPIGPIRDEDDAIRAISQLRTRAAELRALKRQETAEILAADEAWRNELDAAGTAKPVPRQVGRPKGTRSLPRDVIVEKYRELVVELRHRPTQQQLADNLDRLPLSTLRGLLTAYGLAWPIE